MSTTQTGISSQESLGIVLSGVQLSMPYASHRGDMVKMRRMSLIMCIKTDLGKEFTFQKGGVVEVLSDVPF